MRSFYKRNQAFTLPELLISAAVTGILSMGILTYASMSLRMVSRNLTVNHGHDVARASLERLFSDLHNSASQFTLINVDAAGANYSDVSPTFTASSDADYFFSPSPNQYLINDNRANGVRFFRPAGTGPYQLTGDGVITTSGTISPSATTLEFDFANSGYVPSVGDKLQIPLINSGEFDVVAPAPTNTTGTKYKVNISPATGYYLYVGTATTNTNFNYNSANPANTAGYFYQRVAYTVLNNQLRFHPNFTDPPSSYPCASWAVAAADKPVVIRNNVASIAPFSVLTSGTGTASNFLYLRVSLVAYDLNYSSRAFKNGATTVQAIIPPRSVSSLSTTLSSNAR